MVSFRKGCELHIRRAASCHWRDACLRRAGGRALVAGLGRAGFLRHFRSTSLAADGPDIQPASVGIGKAQACAEAVVGVQPWQAALQSAALIFTKEKLSR
jgi:hypothetical protein